MSVLEIKNLRINYITRDARIEAVNGINLSIEKGETLGLVGETGAGKTTTALGIMGLVPDPPGKILEGEILFNNKNLLTLGEHEMRKIRGNEISMIFQDPMSALNPTMRIGEQIFEVIRLHSKCSKEEALDKACSMLEMVGIEPDRHIEFPHQFSGGMKQRVVIAIALSCNPALLLADEPTTALDVTIQAQVLDMMRELKANLGTSILLITHDLGIVAENCDKVAIMYAGEIIEYGSLRQIFKDVRHPYTIGLFGSLPSLDRDTKRLSPIPGLMPDPANLPNGCRFHPRCPKASEKCAAAEPPVFEVEPGHIVRCHYAGQNEPEEAFLPHGSQKHDEFRPQPVSLHK
ncbi:MAG: ABC transporter ATP-binding protein [Oscillospiraceae bacterium]|jgi:peptide/nickel transport system ATP-binding protein